jgi:predicted membrane protein
MTADRPSFRSPRVVAGLVVAGFGFLMLVDNLGWLDFGDVLRFWPLGLIVVGLAKVMQDDQPGRVLGWIMVGLGVLFATENIYFLRFDVWRWWPLAIIILGILIVAKAFQPQAEMPKDAAATASPFPRPPGPAGLSSTGSSTVAAGAAGETRDSKIEDFVMWAGLERRVTSSNFRQAGLTAVMGGIEFDLRQASTDNGHAEIEVFVLWGGIEITVPPDWAVTNNITPIMGGVEDKSTGTQQSRHHLTVKGLVLMGGVDIKT